ncbi:MAG: ABC transporter substrate-binding protein [Clostridiales bacterium]|nr:ABC transporter substrate-binding protein [Clostridiales bacterium]
MKRKLLATALCLSVAAAALTACSNSDLSSEESGASEDSFTYPITLEDAYGNEVTIEEEPSTVVSVSPALTEIVYALGGEDKLIGRSDYDDYPEAVFEVQSVGPIDLPDTELIVSLDPDVVLASSIFSEEAYNALTDAGITVVIIKDESDIDGMYTYIQTTADVIGMHDAGAELCSSLEDELASIEADAQENVADEDLTVYYCMGYGEYGDYTAGGDTFINDIIEAAGCVNVAGDIEGWSYSTEQLLAADPDIILVPSWGYDAFLVSEPYSELTAVQTGNVIPVDNNLFERVGPRNVEAVRVLLDAALTYNAALDAAA